MADRQTQLREIQDRQVTVAQRLAQVQQQLYVFEEQYLKVTNARGNFHRGWETFLDTKSRSDKRNLMASDRAFSFSSLSSPIPKEDLDKDVDSFAAMLWAEFCEKALEERASKRQKPTPGKE